jgi:hypothetical protein
MRYDVFLSHNSQDKLAVERVGRQLQELDLHPWLDKWWLTPGGRWEEEIVSALNDAACCAVFVGPHGIGDWHRHELQLALDRAIEDRSFRVFLVLLPGLPEPFEVTTLPPALSAHTWVDLRKGIDDPQALQYLVHAVKGLPIGPERPYQGREGVCPYRGLRNFDEEHADFFFGRDADVQRLLEKLKASRFLAVLGASGSGKSSLIRAGLIPALRRGALPDSYTWPIRLFTPGPQPLAVLANELAQLAPGSAPAVSAVDLKSDPAAFHLAVQRALADAPDSELLVWVVDQFEEVFTLAADEQERARFLANLLYAAAVPGGRNVVILTMRSDFYPRCAAYPELATRVAAHQYLVGPLDTDGLRQAIEEPARLVGLSFEPGLVHTIVDDVARQPGSLPLLEHALFELWERRREGRLTVEAYLASGGVQGAISQRADALYQAFTEKEQALAREVLLRLTQLGEDTDDTRRRASVAELVSYAGERDLIEHLVRTLVDARLLTISSDPRSGEQWVEITHEALIRAWPRLRAWLDADRAVLRVQHRLTEAAQEWELWGRDEGLIYRGARLVEAVEWRPLLEPRLNDQERAFLDASLMLHEREAVEQKRRRSWERWLAIAALALAPLLTIAFNVILDLLRVR